MNISIHAPLRERPPDFILPNGIIIISIHAPLRERQLTAYYLQVYGQFQSTLPCGSDFKVFKPRDGVIAFQSTLPCGSDLREYLATYRADSFQSTLPCGSDLLRKKKATPAFWISIHAPLRERLKLMIGLFAAFIFQSTLPCGSDKSTRTAFLLSNQFQSTLPCGSDLS